VTGDASFGLDRGVFVNKRTLFVYVTLKASRVDTSCEPRLFQFKPAVRIMAIAAFHGAFKHLVTERQLKLVLGLAMTTHTELWFARR
jgi:hypothetical protein